MDYTVAEAERLVIGIWAELLETEVDRDDDFFDVGGYSLLVAEVVDRARAAGLGLTALDVFGHPTAAGLAAHVVRASGPAERPGDPQAAGQADLVAQVWRTSLSPWDEQAPGTLVPLVPAGADLPLFCVHLGTGHVRLFTELAEAVRGDRPVYGIESVGYRAPVRPFLSVAETADYHLAQLRKVQPSGPYHLTGLCAGAVIALEMGQRIKADGGEIGALVLVDLPFGMPELDPGWGLTGHYEYLIGMLRTRFGLEDRVADLPRVLAELKRLVWFEQTDRLDDFYRLTVLWAAVQFAQEHYEPRRFEGPVTVITAAEYEERSRQYWGAFLPDAEFCVTDDVRMVEILKEPRVAESFRRALGS